MPLSKCEKKIWWRSPLLAMLILIAGCERHQADFETPAADLSPEVQTTLQQLNHEFRRTMLHHHLTRNFTDFVAARPDLTIPAPPTGKKYAISEHWKVIVVDASTAKQ